MWEIGAFGELHATTTQETSEAKGILVFCMSVDPESWVWFPAWACVESETMGHGRLRSWQEEKQTHHAHPLCVWATLRVNTGLALTSPIAMLAGRFSPETPGLRLRMLTSSHLVTASKTSCLEGMTRCSFSIYCLACSHLGSVVVLLQALFLFEPTKP
ncbi:uncharacterized protein BO66DRAFT_152532 [Aspergillus aculeatinus CBS 121060]|uniref:Uncharacterized protein n=1 Tax=Aspergillus aculeatinus CBS 121060 TaxID=1448322 RepID=A0ACD1H172_9EURO|nr:hypothetical protein BO66DRAFT_152532 [Aspergillus aculeatinus CBS 121060]RAH67502.1 hypothetical protein BO66DRAFT_152532 [Aspergillus aculeatinus CBS 121060]